LFFFDPFSTNLSFRQRRNHIKGLSCSISRPPRNSICARKLYEYSFIILGWYIYNIAAFRKLSVFFNNLCFGDPSFVGMTNYTEQECVDSCFNKKDGCWFSSIHSPQTCHSDKGGITSKGSVVLFKDRAEIQSVRANHIGNIFNRHHLASLFTYGVQFCAIVHTIN
jgi:hypothetical protein